METINDSRPGDIKQVHLIDYVEPNFASYLYPMNIEIKATSSDEDLTGHSYTVISKTEWMNLQYFFTQRQWYIQNLVFLRFLYPTNCWMAIADSRVHATSTTEKGIAKWLLENRCSTDPLAYVVHHCSDLLMTVEEAYDLTLSDADEDNAESNGEKEKV